MLPADAIPRVCAAVSAAFPDRADRINRNILRKWFVPLLPEPLRDGHESTPEVWERLESGGCHWCDATAVPVARASEDRRRKYDPTGRDPGDHGYCAGCIERARLAGDPPKS